MGIRAILRGKWLLRPGFQKKFDKKVEDTTLVDFHHAESVGCFVGEGIQDSRKGKGVEGFGLSKSSDLSSSSLSLVNSRSINKFVVLESTTEREEIESISLDIIKTYEEERVLACEKVM